MTKNCDEELCVEDYMRALCLNGQRSGALVG